MPGQVIGYVRVSTVDQNPERQILAIQAATGAEPDRWFTDHSSGGSTDRPALTAMLTHVRDQDVIVVSSMDRLARSVVDLDQLVTRLTTGGVTIRFLKEGLTFQASREADPLATFQLQLMAAFAQPERALIRDRQREGIEAAKARGVYRGRTRRLSPEQVVAARAEVSSGVPKTVVARHFGIARQTLYDALAPGMRRDSQDALTRRGAWGPRVPLVFCHEHARSAAPSLTAAGADDQIAAESGDESAGAMVTWFRGDRSVVSTRFGPATNLLSLGWTTCVLAEANGRRWQAACCATSYWHSRGRPSYDL